MNVLVACEFSGRVREAFSKIGHYAMSCDFLPSEIPGRHYQGDVLEIINDGWDLIIAHPPCTHLAVSGARYFAQKQQDGSQKKAVDFVISIANSQCNKIAIENPISILSTVWRKPDQIIQPYEFGEPESKKTCLWLKNLPLLVPTNILPMPDKGYWDNQCPSGQNKLSPSPDRAKNRSRTYQGIADAMATQWGVEPERITHV